MAAVPYVIGDPYVDANFAALTAGTLNGAATTANATPTTVATLAVAANSTVVVNVLVAARRTGGSAGSVGDSAGFALTVVAKNIAGTVTVLPTVVNCAYGDQLAWKVAAVASSANVLLQVTGAVNNNINWAFSGQQVTVS